MLHITNGDEAAHGIRDARIPGVVVPWRDVLHEGPVPSDLSFEDLRSTRARFLAAPDGSTFDEVLREFVDRDRVLTESLTEDEVVLWFEHDLYDQLQLIQVLDWFAVQALDRTRLSLICAAEYLGPSTPERLRERFPARHHVSSAELGLARRAWRAFRSSDPTALTDFLREETSALPFLGAALLRHLQQFPSVTNGLSRSEAQALEAIAAGVMTIGHLFCASHLERESVIFLGDTTFVMYLEGLSDVQTPLVRRADGQPVVLRGPIDDNLWNSEVRLTSVGRDVLAGKRDWIRLNGIDRWLGGTHLIGPEAQWRWDDAAQRLDRQTD